MAKHLKDLVVWQISDGKPGHERQVSGLVNALERILIRHRLELHKFNGGFVKLLLELYAYRKKYLKKKPNLIIGAGHKTHLTIILLSKILEANRYA